MTVFHHFMASVGSNSEKGHQLFMKYVDSFDRHESWDDVKSQMSEGFKKFLRLTDDKNGEEQ